VIIACDHLRHQFSGRQQSFSEEIMPVVEINITPESNGSVIKIDGKEVPNARAVRVSAEVNKASSVVLELVDVSVKVNGASQTRAIYPPPTVPATPLTRYRFVNVYRTKAGRMWISAVGVATMAEADQLAAGIHECCNSQRVDTASVPYDPVNRYVNFFESRGHARQGAAHPSKDEATQIGKIAEPLYGTGARYLGCAVLLG
jgi:hypothetical protein